MCLISSLIRNFSRNWVHRPAKSPKTSASEKPSSRSYYKLLELNERYNIIQPGQRVLDLGSAPGGWTEVAVNATKANKDQILVYSVDIESHSTIDGNEMIIANISKEETHSLLLKSVGMPVDVVISDCSANSSEDRDVDSEMQWSLTLDALRICNLLLKKGGVALLKMYLGIEESNHFETVKEFFQSVERVKTSLSTPREVFYLSKGWKLTEPIAKSVPKEDIKTLTEQLLASGITSNPYSVDADLEAKIRQQIGDFDRENPKYKYLKDEDEAFNHYTQTVGNPSFNKEIPERLDDLERIVKSMSESNTEPENTLDEEMQEEDYNKKLERDIKEQIKSMGLENPELYSEEWHRQLSEDFENREIMKNFSSRNMEESFSETREKIFKEVKRAKNNPTNEFEDWQEAGKDSEFWNN